MAPPVLHRVCYGSSTPTAFQKSLLQFQPAILHGYCRRRVLGCDYPAIVPSADDTVRGTYVRGLTDGDIWRLDVFEGSEYDRRKVRINILDVAGNENGEGNVEGVERETETYVWIADKEELEEREWDFAEFRRDKMQNWVGGSSQYDGKSKCRDFGHCKLVGLHFEEYAERLHEDLDEALQAQEHDPTGGRGANGKISGI
ncbi:MAG: hypothetical protein Q9167_002184 [Letrouitia subvulpina]